MNWDQIEGNWSEFKSNIKLHWEKITDDQLDSIAGKRDHLAGRIQVMYGINHEEAEHELNDWQNNQISIDGKPYSSKLADSKANNSKI